MARLIQTEPIRDRQIRSLTNEQAKKKYKIQTEFPFYRSRVVKPASFNSELIRMNPTYLKKNPSYANLKIKNHC
jgi:hypothetical protein